MMVVSDFDWIATCQCPDHALYATPLPASVEGRESVIALFGLEFLGDQLVPARFCRICRNKLEHDTEKQNSCEIGNE